MIKEIPATPDESGINQTSLSGLQVPPNNPSEQGVSSLHVPVETLQTATLETAPLGKSLTVCGNGSVRAGINTGSFLEVQPLANQQTLGGGQSKRAINDDSQSCCVVQESINGAVAAND